MLLSPRTWLSRTGRVALATLVIVIAATAVATDPADARARRKKSWNAYKPPYAAIVVDANSGQTLHAASADSTRHPASLTKIMTLYLLFEQLEAGKLKLDSRLEVSDYAASQAPSKLGLKPGQTIAVEDAIKALVTKSANDIAVVVAEGIAGGEEEFAKRMTRKARALGMNRTIYTNASGLPDPDQVTTARDQSILGRAIQDRFPRYYRYFATASFHHRGATMRNHNKLLGRMPGIDGIKTGYTRASGFNLVSSMRRGNRHVVAVVLGGASGAARDARMRDLLERHVKLASVERSASKIAEAPSAAEPRRVRQTAAPAPAGRAASAVEANPETTATVAAPAEGPAAGSSEPIRPVAVKTITVRAGSPRTAALSSVTFNAPLATTPPQSLAANPPAPPPSPAPQPILASAATAPVPPPGARPGVLGVLPARSVAPAPPEKQAAAPQTAPAAAAVPPAPLRDRKPVAKGGWVIQVGAFPDEGQAKQRLKSAQDKAKTVLAKADPFTEPVMRGQTQLYRARFAGFDQDAAEAACKQLKRSSIACMAVKQ